MHPALVPPSVCFHMAIVFMLTYDPELNELIWTYTNGTVIALSWGTEATLLP
jgi:hypothetical protein